MGFIQKTLTFTATILLNLALPKSARWRSTGSISALPAATHALFLADAASTIFAERSIALIFPLVILVHNIEIRKPRPQPISSMWSSGTTCNRLTVQDSHSGVAFAITNPERAYLRLIWYMKFHVDLWAYCPNSQRVAVLGKSDSNQLSALLGSKYQVTLSASWVSAMASMAYLAL